MNGTKNILARRYADAYLNVFGDSITVEMLSRFDQVAAFFKNNQQHVALLLAPSLDKAVLIENIAQVFKKVGLPDCRSLIRLLIHMNRLELLPDVLLQIRAQYKLRHHLFDCSIVSSHALTEQNKRRIDRFLDHTTQHTYMKKYDIDATLIAGIRIVGDDIFWEYSIRRYLAEIGRKIIR